MNVFELYKPFRNKVSLLSIEDTFFVIWAYSQKLQIKDFRIPKGIEVHQTFLESQIPQSILAEWELEILTKEVILNGGAVATKGHTFRSWSTLADIVNQLKTLENEIYRLYGSGDNILMELIRIAHRQFVWQGNRPNKVAIIRYYKIFNEKIINEICLDRLGISVEEIYHCGTAFMGVFLEHPAINIPFKTDIKQLSQEKFIRFLSFTCKSIYEIKSLLKSDQKYDDRFAYAYNSLRAYPLIRMRFRANDAIACPLTTLLFWRITGGLYYELLEDTRFSGAFGSSFQRYVGEVIQRACRGEGLHVFAEQEYGVGKARKDSVDWIVGDDASAIFLECKAKRLSWGSKEALGDLEALHADIDIMASAIIQIYKTIIDYTNDQYSHFRFDVNRKIYPVVVTLENWYFFGGRMLDMLRIAVVSKLGQAQIRAELLDDMPYSVWSIEEFEVAMQIIDAVGIQSFLDGKINDPEMKQWDLHAYMRRSYGNRFPAKTLFSDEYDEIFARLTRQ